METNDINNMENTSSEVNPTNMTDEELDTLLNAVGLDDSDSQDEDNDDGQDVILDTDDEESSESSSDNVEEPSDSSEIPQNSPSLLVDESTTRFSGAEWFNAIQRIRVIVAGIGGIGSNFCFQLARMLPANITMYDDDIVEKVNMAGQLYCADDIGKAKVDAIASMISSYTAMRQVNAIMSKFTENTEPGDIMVCGFDNMKARKEFFNSWLYHIDDKSLGDSAKCLFIDGRLSMDTLQVLCIRGDDEYNIDRYQREFLFSDAQAEQTVCSRKQTTYLACMIGSVMVNLLTNFIANTLNPVIPYDLPFFTEYDSQQMLFKTEN